MSVSLRNSSQYKVSSLSARRKIVIGFLVLSAFLLLLLSSSPFLLKSNADTLASNLDNNHRDSSILSTHDMDGDGLNDTLEGQLGTLVNDSKGDLDNDGLYDFEEYLDYYGNNDTTDGRKYAYNDSTTFDDDNNEPILDIYHYFNFSKNGSGVFRDRSFTGQRSGFTNHLLWNVTFSGNYAGGSNSGNVLYLNNTIVGCTFSGEGSGGTQGDSTNYTNNVVLDTKFTGFYSGGNEFGGDTGGPPALHYKNNTFTNVIFSNDGAGGAVTSDAGILYSLNTFTNVNFTGRDAGGSENGPVTYGNNLFSSVIFSGKDAGVSEGKITTYGNNTFDRVQFSGTQSLNLAKFSSANNTIVENGDTYDSDGDKLMDLHELLTLGTNPTLADTDGDGLDDRWEVEYNGTPGVNPLIVTDSELSSDMDNDSLNLSLEVKAFTNPDNPDTDGDGLNDSYEFLKLGTEGALPDTDGDGLNDGYEVLTSGTNATLADTDGDGLGDGWEVKYNDTSGVNPLVNATADELASDTDNDGLNLTEESKANTNPLLSDTDGDGLNDGYEVLTSGTNATLADTDGDGFGDAWEAKYSDAPGVNPLVNATAEELASDTDSDGLNLTEEFKANTDPGNADTDGDGLGDGWEVKYNSTSGVNPLVAATAEELASDTDNDGLNLTEEFKANLDPGTADNPMQMNTTSTASASSSSETSDEGSFTLLVVLAVFASFSLVFVVYRIRRRML